MKKKASAAAVEIAATCVAVRMRAVNRAITSIYEEALRPLDVKASQLNVLVAIHAHPGVQPSQLARGLVLEKSTLSRNVEKMRARGWLTRVQGEGRGHTLQLTSAGEELLVAALPLWRAAQERAEHALGERGVAAVHSLHEGLTG